MDFGEALRQRRVEARLQHLIGEPNLQRGADSPTHEAMPVALPRILDALEAIAPLSLAEDWDNVGLLVDAVPRRKVRTALLTIDLTAPVLAEALDLGAELIVAYHPPIFGGIKRLRGSVPGERTILRAVRKGIAIYSPHTALDAAAGGVNDWLADGLGRGTRTPIQPRLEADGTPSQFVGQGRRVTLHRPAPLGPLVKRLKRHLGLAKVRLATAEVHATADVSIRTVALCAGAGGSVLAGQDVDLWWTGEMRHHDVLAAVARGTSVLLSEHTHTERGYLPRLAAALTERLAPDAIDVRISAADGDPLAVV